nr:hypothetical protein [Flaviflexus ciconiae]
MAEYVDALPCQSGISVECLHTLGQREPEMHAPAPARGCHRSGEGSASVCKVFEHLCSRPARVPWVEVNDNDTGRDRHSDIDPGPIAEPVPNLMHVGRSHG